ncbi:MltR family transcriptional regulator, partial [Vibrio owensii]
MSREDELLEKLDECENATAFLQVSNKIINLKLKALLPSVFVQDDLVKEYAVDP